MVVYVAIYCLTRPEMESVENRGGFLMDTWLAYLVARFCITDRASIVRFIKAIAAILAPLALLGIFEAVTHIQPFVALQRYRPWETFGGEPMERRWGLSRGMGAFPHPIMFGSCFIMFLPLIWCLRRESRNWNNRAKWAVAIVAIGAMSSMSSGPWGMLMVVVFCMAMERYSYRLKAILAGFVIMCVLLEVVSNRPFYHPLLEFGNLGRGSWYQRAKLIDSAIETIGDWWVAGYYGEDPGWGAAVGIRYTDLNNEFLLKGVRYGMLGVIALAGAFVLSFDSLAKSFKETKDKELRALYWGMGSSLVGIIVMWQGVSYFGSSVALFYCLLGTIGSSFGLTRYAAVQTRPVSTMNNDDLMSLYGQV